MAAPIKLTPFLLRDLPAATATASSIASEAVSASTTETSEVDRDSTTLSPISEHNNEREVSKTPTGAETEPVAEESDNLQRQVIRAHSNLANPFITEAILAEPQYGRQVALMHAVIKEFDPNANAAFVAQVRNDLYSATGGDESGREIYDWWRRSADNYPGTGSVDAEWNQSATDTQSTDRLATADIAERTTVEQHGSASTEAKAPAVLTTTMEGVAPADPIHSSELCAPALEKNALSEVPTQRRPRPLDPYSLKGMALEIGEMAGSSMLFLGVLGLLGQLLMLFAMPNTGKTLIVQALLIDAIIRGLINPGLLYYINLDDSLKGLAEKLHIADEYGFNMLVEGFNDFSVKQFMLRVQEMIDTDQARGVIIVLDTWKRFMDVMDKKQVAKFTRLMRLFVLAGGTVIGLAHTNKNLGANGKPVPAGTSDVLDDCDCAYVLRVVDAKTQNNEKVIEAENIKRRGDVAQTAAFTYSLDTGISYLELLSSVRMLETEKLNEIKQAGQLATDAQLIEIVACCLGEGIDTKMRLRDAIVQRAGLTNRAAVQLLDKYSGNEPGVHLWSYSVHARGAKVYALIGQSDRALQDDGSSK